MVLLVFVSRAGSKFLRDISRAFRFFKPSPAAILARQHLERRIEADLVTTAVPAHRSQLDPDCRLYIGLVMRWNTRLKQCQ